MSAPYEFIILGECADYRVFTILSFHFFPLAVPNRTLQCRFDNGSWLHPCAPRWLRRGCRQRCSGVRNPWRKHHACLMYQCYGRRCSRCCWDGGRQRCWWRGVPWCFRGAGRRLAGGEHKQPWRHCHSRRANSLAQLLINNQRLKASIHLNSLIGNGQQYKKESE